MARTTSSHDVIVVGGGPVGLTLAASLVRFSPGVSIAIVERRSLVVPDDARASALAAGVVRIFEGLGLWGEMKPAASPVEQMKITDSGHGDIARPLFLKFEGEVVPGQPFAYMVPNRITLGALMEAIAGKAELVAPAEIARLYQSGNSGVLDLKDGRSLAAPLIVAADGAQSSLRSMAGISVVGHDYGQSGIVTTIAHELDHENTAFEHFRPAGPFASLPLPNRQSSLVWTEHTDAAREYAGMPPQDLAQVIEAVMGSSLGRVRVADKVQVFPLRLQIARAFVAPRLALIGDAAHVVHPIAGQGLNLGLKDVAALAEVIVEAMRRGEDHGAADVLDRYQRWRRFDTALMAMATDGLNRLFSNDAPPLRAMRDLGLGLVDRLPLLKTRFIRHAAGIGPGPRLLAGQAI